MKIIPRLIEIRKSDKLSGERMFAVPPSFGLRRTSMRFRLRLDFGGQVCGWRVGIVGAERKMDYLDFFLSGFFSGSLTIGISDFW